MGESGGESDGVKDTSFVDSLAAVRGFGSHQEKCFFFGFPSKVESRIQDAVFGRSTIVSGTAKAGLEKDVDGSPETVGGLWFKS